MDSKQAVARARQFLADHYDDIDDVLLEAPHGLAEQTRHDTCAAPAACGVEVLTDDLDLYVHVVSQGWSARNFNHYRSIT